MVGSRVYIGGLPYGTNERDLERFFRGYGRMREITIKSGYGFVEFEDYRDADDAVYELNGKRILGERVTVERARGTPRGRDRWGDSSSSGSRGRDRDRGSGRDRYGPPTRTAHRVIVENLSSRVSWQDLKDYMRQAGEVTYADAHREHKNEGVVEFASRSDMKNAVEKLDDTELNGRRIRVVEDKAGRKRRDSSSRSRSRSRSARRSRSGSKSKSRSKSRSKSKDNKASRSRSRSVKRSRSRSTSRDAKRAREDRSRSRSKANGREDRSKSKEDDRDARSKSRASDRSRSKSKENGRRSRSVSRDRSKSREASKEGSRSKSRSRSKSN